MLSSGSAHLTCCIHRMAGMAASGVLKCSSKVPNAPIQIIHLPMMTRLLSYQTKDERWQASTVDDVPCLAAGPPYSDCRSLSHFPFVTQCSSASCLVPAGELLSFAMTLQAAVHAKAGIEVPGSCHQTAGVRSTM